MNNIIKIAVKNTLNKGTKATDFYSVPDAPSFNLFYDSKVKKYILIQNPNEESETYYYFEKTVDYILINDKKNQA